MKPLTILLAASYLALAGCSPNATEPPQENLGAVYLTVDQSTYSPEDTVHVTLHNDSNEPVFLEGCNQLFLATKTDTGWVEGAMWDCVWEGFAVKINPGGIFQGKHVAKYFSGVHKFVAPIYFACLDDKPISEGKCIRREKISSPEFNVIDNRFLARGYWEATGGDTQISSGIGLLVYNWYAIDIKTAPDVMAVTWDDGLACTTTIGTITGNRIRIVVHHVEAVFELQDKRTINVTFKTDDKTYKKTLAKKRDDPKVYCF